MIQASVPIFEDLLTDMARSEGRYHVTTYPSLEHTALLSSADHLGFQAIAHSVAGEHDVPVILALEHSGNGRTFQQKNAVPEVAGLLHHRARAGSWSGGEPWPARPSQRFVRLRIEAGDGHHPFSIKLVIHAIARTRTTKVIPEPRAALPVALRRSMLEAMLGLRGETITEVQELMRASRHLDGAERHDHVLRHLSTHALADVRQIVARLGALDEDARRVLASTASGLLSLLGVPSTDAAPGRDDDGQL